MAIKEMDLYSELFEDVKYQYSHLEDFAWGEELIEYKIKVYKNEPSAIPHYSQLKKNLIKVGLITINPKVAGMIIVVQAMLDTVTELLYVKENEINRYWKYLRKSISIGIENSPGLSESKQITKPEDILDLEYLRHGEAEPYIDKNHRVAYGSKIEDKERLQLKAKRQRMMDDPKLLYVFSSGSRLVHDKSCKEILGISDEDFMASAEFPEDGIWCSHCYRMNVIRRACYPFEKQIQFCDYIFKNNEASLNLIEQMIKDGFSFHANDASCLEIQGREDKWEIHISSDRNSLWHNNYVRIGESERSFTDGFHDQGIYSAGINKLLNYIYDYTWEKHLATEQEKLARIDSVHEELATQPVKEEKPGLFKRIVVFIKNLF